MQQIAHALKVQEGVVGQGLLSTRDYRFWPLESLEKEKEIMP